MKRLNEIIYVYVWPQPVILRGVAMELANQMESAILANVSTGPQIY